jgi:hypothetical protein
VYSIVCIVSIKVSFGLVWSIATGPRQHSIFGSESPGTLRILLSHVHESRGTRDQVSCFGYCSEVFHLCGWTGTNSV